MNSRSTNSPNSPTARGAATSIATQRFSPALALTTVA